MAETFNSLLPTAALPASGLRVGSDIIGALSANGSPALFTQDKTLTLEVNVRSPGGIKFGSQETRKWDGILWKPGRNAAPRSEVGLSNEETRYESGRQHLIWNPGKKENGSFPFLGSE